MATFFQRLGAARFEAHQAAARSRGARQRNERMMSNESHDILCYTFATLSSELLRDNVEEGNPSSDLGPCECTDQGATRRWNNGHQVRVVMVRDDWGNGPMCVGCGRIHTQNFHYEE